MESWTGVIHRSVVTTPLHTGRGWGWVFLVHHHLLYISQSVIAAYYYLIAWVETIDNFVLLGVLTTYLYVHTACHVAAFLHAVNPTATGLLVEVATGYDDGLFGLAKFYLYTITLAQAYVLGDGVDEEQVGVELAVLDLGDDTADAQGEGVLFLNDGGRQTGMDALDIVFAQLGVYLVLVHNLELSYHGTATYGLTDGKVDVSQLSVLGCTDNETVYAPLCILQLACCRLTVGNNHLATQDGGDGVVAKALHLQEQFLVLVLIVFLGYGEFGTALDAHGELLAALGEFSFEACQLMALLQGLHVERDALLLHLYLLFAEVALGLFPLLALFLYGAHEFGIVEHEDGVATAYHGTLFADNLFDEATLEGIDLYGHDGVHDAFGFEKLHEGGFLNGGNLDALRLDALTAWGECHIDGVDNDACKYKASKDVHAVLNIPGAGREFDVHR